MNMLCSVIYNQQLKTKVTILLLLWVTTVSYAQVQVDLNRSVPIWLNYDSVNKSGSLNWIEDTNANEYQLYEINYNPFFITPTENLDGTSTSYVLDTLIPGKEYGYIIGKNSDGQGVIRFGLEIPAVHQRGRCLIAIDAPLVDPLELEIDQLIQDMEMDGWEIDTLNVERSRNVFSVKERIIQWYDENYSLSQSLFILGHVAVPYSGNAAHDGHNDHQGAWSADVFYGDIDGQWTDSSVNNTSPSRDVNKNIPGDGKYDQTSIPSDIEIEIGRVDFHDMPALGSDEIQLTRAYLNKNHEFKIGNNKYPKRALVENNFASFAEGFGQSGWRNFTTMFGGDSVSIQNYESVLEDQKYLCSYACGPGSYTSCGGVGNINNLWASKDIQTVFTMTFGSYFGDWDSTNNFLRGALASGDILINAWAGRPVWQLYDMALGKHIGYSARATQNASGTIFSQGFSWRSAHIALLGDPTLRLHPLKGVSELTTNFENGNIELSWQDSPDADNGYMIYRRDNVKSWELISEFHDTTNFIDECAPNETQYEYMIKAIRLEETGSGTYYNLSLGMTTSISVMDNPALSTYYADNDMDGFGDMNTIVLDCEIPTGYVENDLDCDDTNGDIFPGAEEIPNNDIDEDCDGQDLIISSNNNIDDSKITVYPNPVYNHLYVNCESCGPLAYNIKNLHGQVLATGFINKYIELSNFPDGLYVLEVKSKNEKNFQIKKLIISR